MEVRALGEKAMDFMKLYGRINRKQFLMILSLPIAIVSTLTTIALMIGLFDPAMGARLSDIVLELVIGAVMLFVVAIVVAGQITRLHDLGHTGLWALFNLVPSGIFFLCLYLLFAPGENGPNRFGPAPGQQA